VQGKDTHISVSAYAKTILYQGLLNVDLLQFGIFFRSLQPILFVVVCVKDPKATASPKGSGIKTGRVRKSLYLKY
jgi:hypothetical protein